MNLYEVHETDTSVYIVMEYFGGGELFTRLKEQNILLTAEVVSRIIY